VGDFSTLPNLKSYMQIATAVTTWDTILATLITEKTKAIKSHCGDAIEADDYIEDHDGHGQEDLILNHRPINSVAYVREDYSRAFASSANLDTTLYTFDSTADETNPGIIEFVDYRPPNGKRNVRVSYNAGYATIPTDVVLACHMWVAHVFEQRKDRGLTNQSLGNRSYGLDLSEIPADVRKLLLPYSTGVRSR